MSYGVVAHAAALAAAAAVGWFARGPEATPAPAPALAPIRAAPATAATPTDNAPLIAVASDGNVTLRVEQQPLEWVLEQIAAQSGWPDVKSRARPAAAAGMTTAQPGPSPCAEPVPPVDAAAVLQAIERGSESERFDGLLRARSDGVVVSETTLKTLYETDASERVRLAAFESYLELHAEPREMRQALEAAQYLPNAAIQREARQRLDELHEIERIDALTVQGDP